MGFFTAVVTCFFLLFFDHFCIINSCQFPSYFSLAPLRCSPQALQAAAVSSESLETQEEREKAWRRGGRQPEMSIFCLLGYFLVALPQIQFQVK